MCLPLCACGSENNAGQSNSNEIQLTVDNYSRYLDVSIGMNGSINNKHLLSPGVDIGNVILNESYEAWTAYINVKGLSTNFNYNDIRIIAKTTAKQTVYEKVFPNKINYDNPQILNLEYTFDITLDIAGNGQEVSETCFLPNELVALYFEEEFEIIEISGTVTPA